MVARSLLAALPKTDLHCHLDGSLRPETLLELARERGVRLPSWTTEGLRELVFKDRYRDLQDYLHGFSFTCAVLSDEEALERVAWELGRDCLAEGVVYVEVRLAPHLHVRHGLDVARVLAAVDRGLDRVRSEDAAHPEVQRGDRPGFEYGLVACAMRMFTPGFSPYYRRMLDLMDGWPVEEVYGVASLALARAVVDARDRLGLPVVGFDLAGAEAGLPAEQHVAAYRYVHRHFLKKSVIAGESYGPESIFQAITALHADRIGHGTHLFSVDRVGREVGDPGRYVHQLVEYVADRRITVEVCISSNLLTMPELRRVEAHPVGRMLAHEMSVTLCTDNRLMCGTTVTRELERACEAFDIGVGQLRNLVLHGFKRSFFPGTYRDKRAWIRRVIRTIDRVVSDRDAYPTSAASSTGAAPSAPMPSSSGTRWR